MDTRIIVRKALENGLVITAFTIPHPQMLKAIVQSQSLEYIAEEYAKYAVEGHTLLHLDHVPVIDEDHLEVDYMSIIKRAISAGYGSVMVDGSRLSLEGNI